MDCGTPASTEALGTIDDNRCCRDILMISERSGSNLSDFIHDIHAVNHFPEYGIAKTHGGCVLVVEEVVVHGIDEKLAGSAMDLVCSSHGNGAAVVLEFGIGFVLDRGVGWLFLHIGSESSSLDHEFGDNPVKDGTIIETFIDILQEVFYGNRSLVSPELYFDRTF